MSVPWGGRAHSGRVLDGCDWHSTRLTCLAPWVPGLSYSEAGTLPTGEGHALPFFLWLLGVSSEMPRRETEGEVDVSTNSHT